jgi:rubrerythrin
MDIYEYAMQMERDGENYYRDLAEKTPNKGLRSILTMLADAEVTHYNLLRKMKKQEEIRLTDAGILNDVKNIFVKMREQSQSDVDVSQIELYRKAQELEGKTRDFYLEKSDEADAAQKEIFLRVADEEKKHYLILEKIIDFVNRPDIWLENPEWYHIEEY